LVGFVAVGLALGLLGGGGGILAVPVLIYVMGFPPKTAAVMSLVVVGLAAALGALVRWKRGQLRLRTAALFAVCSMVMAYLAPRLGADLPDHWRIVLAIVTMLLAAGAMWRRSGKVVPSGSPPVAQVVPAPGRIIPTALATGTLTGLIGVGGGFLIVPALTGVLGMPIAEATATSLAVIVLNTAAAGLGYLGQVALDPVILVEVVAAALVGIVLGTRLAPHLSARTLTRGFAILLVVVSGIMFMQEFDLVMVIRR
jgi:uncharacterized membrane protein YfcA